MTSSSCPTRMLSSPKPSVGILVSELDALRLLSTKARSSTLRGMRSLGASRSLVPWVSWPSCNFEVALQCTKGIEYRHQVLSTKGEDRSMCSQFEAYQSCLGLKRLFCEACSRIIRHFVVKSTKACCQQSDRRRDLFT